jgi:hypothetical protein
MVDITEISAIVTAAGVLVGVVYYILDMRHQARTRQMDLFMRLYSTFTSKEFTEAGLAITSLEIGSYSDFVEKFGMPSAEKPVWTALYMSINYLNEVGMLLHRGFIDIESADELFGYRIAVLWEKLKPLIEGWRKQLNPQVAKRFEYLYNEMKKREHRGVKNA